MEQEEKKKYGSRESVIIALNVLEKNLELVKTAYKVPYYQQRQDWTVIKPLLNSVIDSLETIIVLTNLKKLRDMYVISRVIVETATNACFIFAKGNEAIERATQHAKQKAYRDLSREVNVSGLNIALEFEGKNAVLFTDELQQAISNFTSKKGREITSWTTESIIEQIGVIGNKYGEEVSGDLTFAFFNIYRHASEIAHGTYFGALFSLGLTNPNRPSSEDELISHINGQLQMLLMMLYATTNALINVLAHEFKELEELSESSKAGLKQLSTII